MNEESACCGNCAFLIDGKCAHGFNGRNMCGEYIRKSDIHTKEWVAEYLSKRDAKVVSWNILGLGI